MTDEDGDSLFDMYTQYLDVDFPEKRSAEYINIYVSPFLLFIGTIGNILSLIIMRKLSKSVSSTCVYLSVLAIVDLVVLYIRCGNDWLDSMAKINLTAMLMVYSDSICKVYPFIFNFLVHLSVWLIVTMQIEGYISTCHPKSAGKMCTLERAKAVILLLTVLLVCVNIHYFWSFELVKLNELDLDEAGYFCTFKKHGRYSEEFQEVVWPLLDILTAIVCPYLTVVVFSILTAVRMCRSTENSHKECQQSKYMMDPLAIVHLKQTFLAISVCYLLLSLPKFVYQIFKYFVEKYVIIPFSFKLEAQMMLTNAICSTLIYILFSFKFFIYCIMCKRFRQELHAMMTSLCRPCRRHRQKRRLDDPIAKCPLMNEPGTNVQVISSREVENNMTTV